MAGRLVNVGIMIAIKMVRLANQFISSGGRAVELTLVPWVASFIFSRHGGLSKRGQRARLFIICTSGFFICQTVFCFRYCFLTLHLILSC